MKPQKSVVLLVFLGLLLFAFAIGIAQDPQKSTNKKQIECCCAAESCPMSQSGESEANCCQNMSCDMKHDGEKKHDDNSCCCGSDSCDMKSANAHKQHAGGAVCCKAKHDKKSKSKTR
jgi:hypothetical protein